MEASAIYLFFFKSGARMTAFLLAKQGKRRKDYFLMTITIADPLHVSQDTNSFFQNYERGKKIIVM